MIISAFFKGEFPGKEMRGLLFNNTPDTRVLLENSTEDKYQIIGINFNFIVLFNLVCLYKKN